MFRDASSIEAQIDSNGSRRVQIHTNKKILGMPTPLAVRTDLLYEEEEFGTEPGGELDRRFYTSVRYKPYKTMHLRAYYEAFDIQSNDPTRLLAFDQITPWFLAAELPDSGYDVNQPIFENSLDWYESGQDLDGQVFTDSPQAPVYVIGNDSASSVDLASWNRSVVINPLRNWDHISPLNSMSRPYTLLDDKYYPDDLSLISAITERQQKGHVLNLLYNQFIMRGMILEIGYHYEHIRQFNAAGIGNFGYLQVDANAYLPDNATRNPNVGKYYV